MPTLFKNGKNYSGTSVSLTQAEYDALSTTEKNNGTVYFITDSDAVLDASDVALGSGTVEDLAGSIATIETSPATANHAVGEYIVYNGQLYRVTTAITAGQALTVGTNISAVTVASAKADATDGSLLWNVGASNEIPVYLRRGGNNGRNLVLSINGVNTNFVDSNGVILPDYLTITNSVPTINYNYTTSANAKLTLNKFGKVVMLTGSINNTFTCPQYIWLFTIPAAYRPAQAISITPLNGTAIEWFFIDASGQVSPQNGACEVGTRYFTATWITA